MRSEASTDIFSKPSIIHDKNGFVFAVRPSQPKGWVGICENVDAMIKTTHVRLNELGMSDKHLANHHRGEFPSICFGMSSGQGSTVRPLHAGY
jgi:hypothetical protein